MFIPFSLEPEFTELVSTNLPAGSTSSVDLSSLLECRYIVSITLENYTGRTTWTYSGMDCIHDYSRILVISGNGVAGSVHLSIYNNITPNAKLSYKPQSNFGSAKTFGIK